jgi:hypothetical protein
MTTVIDILKGIVSAMTVSIPVEWIAWIRYNGVWAGPAVKIRTLILTSHHTLAPDVWFFGNVPTSCE